MAVMRRFILFDNYDSPIGELSQNDVIALLRRESINGAHSLEISTVRVLDKGRAFCTRTGEAFGGSTSFQVLTRITLLGKP